MSITIGARDLVGGGSRRPLLRGPGRGTAGPVTPSTRGAPPGEARGRVARRRRPRLRRLAPLVASVLLSAAAMALATLIFLVRAEPSVAGWRWVAGPAVLALLFAWPARSSGAAYLALVALLAPPILMAGGWLMLQMGALGG
ncbi:hypothetical protein [Corynebacterium sp. 335C]